MLPDLHSITPEEPATSSENFSLQSPDSTRTDAFFLPKKAFSRNEKRIAPSYSGGWYRRFVFSSAYHMEYTRYFLTREYLWKNINKWQEK